MLDHNEKSQTIDEIEQAEILEIIDHHRLGDIETRYPVYFRSELVGSTSTLIASMYYENGIIPTKGIASVLCAAIISDTIKFKSPTSTHLDISMASRFSKIAEIDIDEFSAKMFKAGSAIEGMSPEKIFNSDFKDYEINQYKIGIGQINSYDPEGLIKLQSDLLMYMKTYLNSNNYNLLLLMVTDVVNEGSFILFTGRDEELPNKVFATEPGTNSIYLKGVVSRKKQVIPFITNALQYV